MPVFSLKEAKELQVKNISENNLKYFPEQPIYGYVIGGYAPPASTQQNSFIKTSLADETSWINPISIGTRTNISAVYNNQYAYYNRGFPQANGCYINRLDFSSDTASEYSSTSFLGAARFNLSAVSGNNYGWFGGGAIQPVPWVVYSTIARLDFSTAVMSLPGVNLPPASAPAGTPTVAGRSRSSTVTNSTYGYFVGGSIANPARTYTNLISRMDFNVETISNPGKNFPGGADSMIGVTAPLFGYFGGGNNLPNSANLSTIVRMDFSNETLSPMPASNKLSVARGFASFNGVASFSYGYFTGGLTQDSTDNHLSTTDRIDFSNETVSASFNIYNNRSQFAAAQSGQSITFKGGSYTYGYFGGGYSIPGTTLNFLTRLDFSSETNSNLPGFAELKTASYAHFSCSNSYYSYFAGGSTVLASDISTIQRLDFATEVASSTGRNIDVTATTGGSIFNSSYGYFCGGNVAGTSYVNSIRRFDFSNETVSTLSPRLPERKNLSSGVSNPTYGYLGGGFFNPPPTRISSVTRFDFSTETINNLPQTFSTGTSTTSASSNKSYGYFFGGLTTPGAIVGTVNKIDFSTENLSTLPVGLPGVRRNTSASTSLFYAYVAGGTPTPTINTCTISRLDFSNESFTNLTQGLPTARQDATGVSNGN